jgi:cytosine/uracil/thiamine/allantoin permease
VGANSALSLAETRTTRLLRTLHATAVMALVVIGIYLYVPRFVGMFELFGSDLPFSARLLMAAYPFAIVLPFGTTACALMLPADSPWRRLFMPSVYVMSIGLGFFVVWALHAPVLMLSALVGI